MLPIQDLGPSEMGRRAIDRTHETPGSAGPAREPAPASEQPAGDRVELSLAARALSSGEDAEVVAGRSQRVAELRRAIEAGELSTPERVERAAERLLGA